MKSEVAQQNADSSILRIQAWKPHRPRRFLQATQWVIRVSNATNLATRIFALTSLGIWQALAANEELPNPADRTAVTGVDLTFPLN